MLKIVTNVEVLIRITLATCGVMDTVIFFFPKKYFSVVRGYESIVLNKSVLYYDLHYSLKII